MGKIYLEVITSKYIKGTSMRNEDAEYVILDIDPDMSFAETDNCILETIKKYSEEHDIMLGIKYNNAMVGTDMHHDQQYSCRVFVEKKDKYFRQVFIEYTTFLNSIYLNWLVSPNTNWEYRADRNTFCRVAKRGGSSF